jgi:DNA polymerase-3 subunit delta
MPIGAEQLAARLAAGPTAPIYLVAGAETLLVQEAADAIRAHLRTAGYAERSIHDVDERFDWNSLHYELGALSLFASRRVFELRLPTGKPGREGALELDKLAESGNPDTVIVVLANDWSNKHGGRWSERIDKQGLMVVCPELRRQQMPDWLAQRLRARGLSATREAVEVLVERVEGNLLAAAQEVDKLALLMPGGSLDADAMAQAVADSARFNVFGMLEAALAGDAARALRMAHSLHLEGDSVLALMGWVAGEVRRIAGYAAVEAAGGNAAAAMRTERVWESRQALYRRALTRHGAARWERFVAMCALIDRMAKGRAEGDPWQVLERLLLALAEPRAAARVLAAC